ncbi:unnamed protein product [Cuscuta epithymum]|uniref:Uncharacterized protein n=1 Tax=Cuscuta epithymum TaxID=186058 RepID=A0AAV0CEC8_9ASTE|nr:unnamed protein product [Cuscuta epithymum]
MEGKKGGGMRLFMAAAAVLVILSGLQPASANLMKVACIGVCMRECRTAGIGLPACLKFCPMHCIPPLPPRQVFHCNLECLNQCIASGTIGAGGSDGTNIIYSNNKNNNNNNNNNNDAADQQKQESCVSSCKSEKCETSPP